jgi:hypothetical protein
MANNWTFTPTDKGAPETPGVQVPFWEDARADFAPYYASRKSETDARQEVENELSKLGAYLVKFQPGTFTLGKLKRHGYNIRFKITGGAEAVIRVAGLPMRAAENQGKIEKVRTQALLIVRDWLKVAITTQVFTPGASVLIQFMLVDGERTLSEVVDAHLRAGNIPQLPPPD